MVRHIVSWNLKPELSEEERRAGAARIKLELESLKEKINGIISLKVITEPLRGSSADICLDSLFESKEALDAYQIHPEHTHVSRFVGTLVTDRRCVDFTEED